MLDASHLSQVLYDRYELVFSVTSQPVSEGELVTIRPDMERNHGFTVELTLGWRSLSLSFKPEIYAADLVKTMGTADAELRTVFSVYAESVARAGAPVQMAVNGKSVDPGQPDHWPEDWNNVEFTLRKGNLPLDQLAPDKPEKEAELIYPWVVRFIGCPLALIPLKTVPPPAPSGEEEGEAVYQQIKKYERSRKNRAACIEIHGASCRVCKLDFGEKYGPELGRGFIHVHHIRPLALMEGPYVLDPASDLIPVCPNCHAMLHKREPPLTSDELIEIMQEKNSTND